MQKVKSGLGGFSKFLFGALAVAALAFLDHPKFKEIIIMKHTITFIKEIIMDLEEKT